MDVQGEVLSLVLKSADILGLLQAASEEPIAFAQLPSLLSGGASRHQEVVRRLIKAGWLLTTDGKLRISAKSSEHLAVQYDFVKSAAVKAALEQGVRLPAEPPNHSVAPTDPVAALVLLADATRAQILQSLSSEPARIRHLARNTSLSHTLVVHHIKKLKASRLVIISGDGRLCVNPDSLDFLILHLRRLASGLVGPGETPYNN